MEITQELLDGIIRDLDEIARDYDSIARDYDSYEYGLPLFPDLMSQMREAIMRRILVASPEAVVKPHCV